MAACALRPILGLLVLALALVAEAWFGFGGTSTAAGVVQLKTANFDSHLKKNSKTLVKFYAPWCGHCKELEPKYEEAAIQLHAKGVSLVKVDASEEPDIAKKFDVEGYPTLLWMEDGKHTPFNGERTTEGIVEWVTAMTSPPVQETFEPPAPGKLPRVVIRGPTLPKKFSAVAKALRVKATWYFVKDTDRDAHEVTLQHRDEDPIVMTSGSADDKDAVTSFFDQNSIPLFGILDGDTFAKYSGKGLIWSLFPDPPAGGIIALEEYWRPTMMAVAKKFQGRHRVTFTDTKMFKDTIDGMLGVKDFPAIVFQPSAGSKMKFVWNGSITSEAIIQWLEDIDNDKVEPVVKSEPVPETNDEPVKVIVGSTLNDEVYNKGVDVMLEIYAPWCGACKEMEPEYKKLAQYVKKWELIDYVTIAKIDGTANDITDGFMTYNGFPTLFFVPAGGRQPMKFEGDRDAKSMWKWMKTNSGKKDEIKATQDKVRASKKGEEL